MKLRTAIGIAAAALSFGAQATVLNDLDGVTTDNDASFAYTHSNLPSGAFTDHLTFTLDPLKAWSASGTATADYHALVYLFGLGLVSQGVENINVNIFGQDYPVYVSDVVVIGQTLNVTIPPTMLAQGGTFDVYVSGHSTGDNLLVGGTPEYTFSLVAHAVPEPGEWALMLSGLGLIGVMVRRRSAVHSV